MADGTCATSDPVLRWALRHGTSSCAAYRVDPTVGLIGLDALFDVKHRWAAVVEPQLVAFPQEGIAARPPHPTCS